MSGIKETKEVLAFVLSLANAAGNASADGEVTFGDITELYKPLTKAMTALNGMGEVASEMGELSQDEMDELVAYVKEELDLPQDGIESMVESGMDVVLKLYKLVSSFKK